MPDTITVTIGGLEDLLREAALMRLSGSADELEHAAGRILGPLEDLEEERTKVAEKLDKARAEVADFDAMVGELGYTSEGLRELTGTPKQIEDLARYALDLLDSRISEPAEDDPPYSGEMLRQRAAQWDGLEAIIAEAESAQREPVEA